MKGNLLNPTGWKFNKKKMGFTLIELNVSMLIQLIVLTLAINSFILIIKNYSVLMNNSKVQNPFDDAVLNIERLLTGYMIESINIQDNIIDNKGLIVINYRIDNSESDIKRKEIKFDATKGKIVLETYKNKFKVGTNIIMIDVTSFSIIKKDKIYYLQITNKNNDKRIMCL
ncbi:MAG: prepilin-type cleavage/methylation domain-containing protein [Clostridium sp.]|uniref:PilW family protein n=1 Tax=Clostridium sp. TaxID=1506 RepID=UPI0025B93ECC|nr:prepilin-type cleavage/methylation domain-containing protein [Clostridium sp.]MCF0149422.1 prepilin-type cleavage/methylation domain-containing protein [Clostridium sp.]